LAQEIAYPLGRNHTQALEAVYGHVLRPHCEGPRVTNAMVSGP
jgi:hypothetical protein